VQRWNAREGAGSDEQTARFARGEMEVSWEGSGRQPGVYD
jgi:hypothetical protein